VNEEGSFTEKKKFSFNALNLSMNDNASFGACLEVVEENPIDKSLKHENYSRLNEVMDNKINNSNKFINENLSTFDKIRYGK